MACHICGQEAVDRCYTCGKLFCAAHGELNCIRCESGIAPGDAREGHYSAARLRPAQENAWWRQREADDYEPPSCHVCKRLARLRCANCEQHYCPEHSGASRLCSSCSRSSNLSLLILLAAILVLITLSAWGLVPR